MTRRRVASTIAGLTTVLALGMAHVEQAHSTPLRCKPSDLDGLYIFAATGWGVGPGATPPFPDPLPPKAIIEWIHFNGDGTLDSPGATLSLDGQIAHPPSGSTGTYTVTDITPPDGGCAGTIIFNSGPHFDLFFAAKADEISMIQTNDGNVLRGTATKVSH